MWDIVDCLVESAEYRNMRSVCAQIWSLSKVNRAYQMKLSYNLCYVMQLIWSVQHFRYEASLES